MDRTCGRCDCWSAKALENKRTDTRWYGKREVDEGENFGLCSQAQGAPFIRHVLDPACPLFNPTGMLGKTVEVLEGLLLPWLALRKSEGRAQVLLDRLSIAADNKAVLSSGLKSCHQAMTALCVETRDDVRPREVTADEILKERPDLGEQPDVKLSNAAFQAACSTAFNTGHSRMAQRLYASLGHVLGHLNNCRVEPVVAALIPHIDVGRPGVMHQPAEELEKEGIEG